VKDNIQKRTVDTQFAVVFDEPQERSGCCVEQDRTQNTGCAFVHEPHRDEIQCCGIIIVSKRVYAARSVSFGDFGVTARRRSFRSRLVFPDCWSSFALISAPISMMKLLQNNHTENAIAAPRVP
jgi:hypothetical protein